MKSRTKSSKVGSIYMCLFFTPFALFGLFAGAKVLTHLASSVNALSWERAPASVHSIHASSKTTGSGEDRSTTHFIKGSYRYSFNNQQYRGSSIGIVDSGGFGFSYERWEDYFRANREVKAYVNPNNPSQSYLVATPVWDIVGFWSIFLVTFGGVGIGGIYYVIRMGKSRRIKEKRQRQFPSEPWRWREDWAQGIIGSNSGSIAVLMWVFAIFWNSISFPIPFLIVDEVKRNPLALIALLFPLVGIFLLILAIRATLRQRRFSKTKLRMSRTPGVIGGSLQAVVELNETLQCDDSVKVVLECGKTVNTRSGSSSSSSRRILWRSEQILSEGTVLLSALRQIPINIEIPSSCHETDDDSNVDWTVTVSAPVKGIDLLLNFEVPVFRTEKSDTTITEESLFNKSNDSESHSLSKECRVKVSREGGTVVVSSPSFAKRFPKAPYIFIGILTVWTGVCGFIFVEAGFVVIPFLFGDLVMVTMFLFMWLYRSEVVTTIDGCTIKHLVGAHVLHSTSISKDSIQDFDVRPSGSMQSGSESTMFYSVFLKVSGREHRVVDLLREPSDGWFIVSQLRAELNIADEE